MKSPYPGSASVDAKRPLLPSRWVMYLTRPPDDLSFTEVAFRNGASKNQNGASKNMIHLTSVSYVNSAYRHENILHHIDRTWDWLQGSQTRARTSTCHGCRLEPQGGQCNLCCGICNRRRHTFKPEPTPWNFQPRSGCPSTCGWHPSCIDENGRLLYMDLVRSAAPQRSTWWCILGETIFLASSRKRFGRRSPFIQGYVCVQITGAVLAVYVSMTCSRSRHIHQKRSCAIEHRSIPVDVPMYIHLVYFYAVFTTFKRQNTFRLNMSRYESHVGNKCIFSAIAGSNYNVYFKSSAFDIYILSTYSIVKSSNFVIYMQAH